MCYYFGRSKSVCDAQIRFNEESEEATRLRRLRAFFPDKNNEEIESKEFGELLNFLKDCVHHP